MKITGKNKITWYLTYECTYSCLICFRKNLKELSLPFEKGKMLLSKLRLLCIEYITFSGGEPLLHPELIQYCEYAKYLGMTISIETNAYLLTSSLIEKMIGVVDQLIIPVDSCSECIEELLFRGNGEHLTHCIEIADQVHEANICLKVNTAINKLTYKENMRPIIWAIDPDIWAISQLSRKNGDNQKTITDLEISDDDFTYFVERHKLLRLKNDAAPIFKYADDVETDFSFVSPAGNVSILQNGKMFKYNLDVFLRVCEDVLSPIKIEGL
jgi:radical S-adenosyl methionine domain-containing protein 2